MGRIELLVVERGRRFKLFVVLFVVLLVGSIVAYAGMGYMSIPISSVGDIVFKTIVGRSDVARHFYGKQWYIVMDVRLPRVLSSAVVGASLSMCGVIFQGILLNPLADPYTLGISAGASFGAAVSIVFPFGVFAFFSTQLVAFLFAILTLLFVMRMATFRGVISPTSLILSGVIVTAFFSAGLSFTKYIAGEEVGSIIFWLMGSFSSMDWVSLLMLTVFAAVSGVIFYRYAEDINVLSFGDRVAVSLGVNPTRLRTVLLVVASVLTAATVSVCGIIGFVGIIVPHLFRFLVGADNRRLLVISALGGAIFLSTADNVSRVWLPVEVPIGVLTALIGGPFFAFVFRKRMKGGHLWKR